MKSSNPCNMNSNSSDFCHSARVTGWIFTLFFSLFSTFAHAQAINKFSDTSCLSTAKPMLLKKGDKVQVNCDTAYLINAYRYRLYEKAKTYLITLSGNTDKMARQVEGSVNQLDSYFAEIQSRYFLLSEEVKKSQSDNAATLKRVNHELDQTHTDLQTAKNDLETIKDNLKKARRKDLKNKWMFGGIGLGAGVILGAILLR